MSADETQGVTGGGDRGGGDDARAGAGRLAVVLGGCGFIGSHLVRGLLKWGWRVRIFDKTYADRTLIHDIESAVEIVEGDAARPDDVLGAAEGADALLHLIHTTVPGSSMADPGFDVESNVAAAVRWLPRVGSTGVGRVIFFSSGGTVYGPPLRPLIDEEHPTDPVSSYGVTKLAVEKYVALYAALGGFSHLILRPSNVYGEGQRLHIGQGVIGVLADRALRGETLEVWGTGEALRDYLYVGDLVEAVRSLLDYEGPRRVFNVASGRGHSVNDILDALGRLLGRLPEVRHTPSRGFDVPVNVLDPARLRAATGWEARTGLDAGLARVVEWLRRERGGEKLEV